MIIFAGNLIIHNDNTGNNCIYTIHWCDWIYRYYFLEITQSEFRQPERLRLLYCQGYEENPGAVLEAA